MLDKADKSAFQHLFGGKPKADPDPPATPADDPDDDLAPCAAIAKNRWITALTVRHADKPWESFQYSFLAVRSVFEPTRFEVEFASHDERYKVVVTGRNLARLYNLVIQARLEWLRAADRDFAGDGEAVVTKVEVVRVDGRRG